jgi:glycerophosphoryl diester phosphodiesterase
MKQHSFFDFPMPIPFAHRGGNEKFPENTIAAFQDAYKLGYRYFETDVHYTAGRELIAFHDTDLQRTVGINGPITSLTRAQRQQLRTTQHYSIPLLDELLTTFPDVYFHIDAKSKLAVEPLVSAIKTHHAENRVCLASFSSHNLKQIRTLLPNVATITTRFEIASLRYGLPLIRTPGPLSRNLAIPPTILYKRDRIPLLHEEAVERLHAKNCKVYIWTINEPAEMRRLLNMGVDGIITDKLRVLKKVLQERQQWVKPSPHTAVQA